MPGKTGPPANRNFWKSPITQNQKCRGGNTADAMGWLILGPMDAGGIGEGSCAEERRRTKRTHTIYPGSGPS